MDMKKDLEGLNKEFSNSPLASMFNLTIDIGILNRFSFKNINTQETIEFTFKYDFRKRIFNSQIRGGNDPFLEDPWAHFHRGEITKEQAFEYEEQSKNGVVSKEQKNIFYWVRKQLSSYVDGFIKMKREFKELNDERFEANGDIYFYTGNDSKIIYSLLSTLSFQPVYSTNDTFTLDIKSPFTCSFICVEWDFYPYPSLCFLYSTVEYMNSKQFDREFTLSRCKNKQEIDEFFSFLNHFKKIQTSTTNELFHKLSQWTDFPLKQKQDVITLNEKHDFCLQPDLVRWEYGWLLRTPKGKKSFLSKEEAITILLKTFKSYIDYEKVFQFLVKTACKSDPSSHLIGKDSSGFYQFNLCNILILISLRMTDDLRISYSFNGEKEEEFYELELLYEKINNDLFQFTRKHRFGTIFNSF